MPSAANNFRSKNMRSAFYSRANSYSRSYRATVAETEGRQPMSRAAKTVAAQFGCTIATAKTALELIHDGEWHHVGKFASEVGYHDTTDERLGGVIAHVTACGGAKKFAARRDMLRGTRTGIAVTRNSGRFASLAARRRKTKTEAEAAMGCKITEPQRLNDWVAMLHNCNYERLAEVSAARASGWSEQRIALALAEAGNEAWLISEMMR